jgi:hypothetical protein
MNSRTTGIWFVIAAALFAFIFAYERWLHPVATGPAPLLPGLRPVAVTGVQVFPSGAPEISAARSTNGWMLAKPVAYPGQVAAIEALLGALQKLAPTRISAAELRQQTNSEADLGFDNPQARLVIAEGDQSRQVIVGGRTAPGDQVYLRVKDEDDVAVADAAWLNLIPHAADQWRDTALVNAGQNQFDWIVVTNNVRGTVIELRCDPTNHLWHMLRPLQARADADHLTEALQRLETAAATRFVNDSSNADFAAFGLQPADLDLWFGHGANLTAAVHVGRSPTNDPAQAYARREGWNTVLLAARDALAPWRGAVSDFRDTRLFELTGPVAEIEERGANHFILRQTAGTTNWSVAGEKFPADAANVQLYIKRLAGLRIARFVNDTVTAPELPAYGLEAPRREIIFRSKPGDTNSVVADLQFGLTQTNEVFVRCGDEEYFIYAIPAEDYLRLPDMAWEFRERLIWDFKPDDVAQITLHQDGRSRQLVQNNPGKWSLAAGSQGFIEEKYIQQTVQMFHQLAAVAWLGRNDIRPDYGFATNNLHITFELKNGEKHAVDFGIEFPERRSALAEVTLEGDQWAFLFPPALYQLVLSYLTIPPNPTNVP